MFVSGRFISDISNLLGLDNQILVIYLTCQLLTKSAPSIFITDGLIYP